MLLWFVEEAAAEPWHGSLNEAYAHADHVWVGPFPQRLRQLAASFGGEVHPLDQPLPEEGVPYLYGEPSSNPVLGKVLAWHGIALDAGGVTVGTTRVTAADPFLIVSLPRPDNVAEPVVVYTAWAKAAQPDLNRVFHGPTAVVLGRVADGVPKALFTGHLVLDAQGRATGLATGQARLTAAQAVEDLRALNGQLVQTYAGLSDIDADLRIADTSWDTRITRVEVQFASRESWTWTEVWDALVALLEPVQDSHFGMTGSTIDESGTPVARDARLATTLRVSFADGRLVGGEGKWTFAGGPLDVAPPPVPVPADVIAGVPYRFPTVLADGSSAWLIGAFATGGQEPGSVLMGGLPRPLHAPRTTRWDSAPAWSLDAGATPVLSVTTMRAESLDGLLHTAERLWTADRVVLDLRANHGGADTLAQRWVLAFAPQPYRWHGGANLSPGPGSQTERMRAWEPSKFGTTDRGPWDGQLYVLVDGNVASSGETFAMLAFQIPGAVLVGTPTTGCTRYGNIVTHAPLPHSRIVATFGFTRFDVDDVVPIVEGRGMFPAVWLDEPDPVSFLRALTSVP